MNPRHLVSFGMIVVLVAVASGCNREASEPVGTQPAISTATDTNIQATLAQMTQQLRKYSADKKTVPATFEEFAASGYLKPVPTAPAGKKFAIAGRQMEVVLTDQ
jgi:hypothetical protein